MSSRRRTLDPELTILGGRDFVGLVGRLCREQNWEALIAVFGAVGSREKEMAYVSLTDLDTATRVLADAVAALSAPRGKTSPARTSGTTRTRKTSWRRSASRPRTRSRRAAVGRR